MQNQSIFDECSNEMGLGGIIYPYRSICTQKPLEKQTGFNTR